VTTSTRTERCSTSIFRAHFKRQHHSKSPAASLAIPVRWHIEYKFCCIMHSVHTRRCPAYLKNTVQLAAARQSRWSTVFGNISLYLLPRLKTKFGVRSLTLVRPRGTHCPPTSATFQSILTVSESFQKLTF